MVKKIHQFQKKGDFVVVGKDIPRSVGLSYKSSAIKYANYYRKKGKKPKIIKI